MRPCGCSVPARRRLLAAAGTVAARAAVPPAWLSLPGAVAAAAAAPIAWPAIELLDGRRLEPSDWRDTAAVVVFWATHCPFCRRHNAHVEKLHRAVQGQPLRVLSASLDRDEAVVRRYLQAQGHTVPVTMQGAQLRPLFSGRDVMPLTAPVDRAGRPRTAIPGEMFEEDVLDLARLALR